VRWGLSKYEAKVAELLELNGMPPLDGVRGAVRRRRERRRVARGRVRRLIIRNQEDEVLLEVPLTAGVAVGGVVTLVAPVLAALGALAALLTHVKVEIVRARRNERDEEVS
jgi:Flp pilus assembly protein TadB